MRSLILHALESSYGTDAVFEFERSLLRAGDECVTRTLGTTSDILADLQDVLAYDLVVISADDDTAGRILSYLANSDVRICVFPTDAQSNYFSNLGCAAEPSAIARSCRVAQTANLDLGEVFYTTVDGASFSGGFCSNVTMSFHKDKTFNTYDLFGTLSPVARMFSPEVKSTPGSHYFSIICDGKEHVIEGSSLVVANSVNLPGDPILSESCDMSDGLLDVIVAAKNTQPKKNILSRVSEYKNVHYLGQQISVKAQHPMYLYVDEKIKACVTSFECRVLAGANRIIVDGMSRYAGEENPVPVFNDSQIAAYPKQ